MSQVEKDGAKTRGTLTRAEDEQRQTELVERLKAERLQAAKETIASHVVQK